MGQVQGFGEDGERVKEEQDREESRPIGRLALEGLGRHDAALRPDLNLWPWISQPQFGPLGFAPAT